MNCTIRNSTPAVSLSANSTLLVSGSHFVDNYTSIEANDAPGSKLDIRGNSFVTSAAMPDSFNIITLVGVDNGVIEKNHISGEFGYGIVIFQTVETESDPSRLIIRGNTIVGKWSEAQYAASWEIDGPPQDLWHNGMIIHGNAVVEANSCSHLNDAISVKGNCVVKGNQVDESRVGIEVFGKCTVTNNSVVRCTTGTSFTDELGPGAEICELEYSFEANSFEKNSEVDWLRCCLTTSESGRIDEDPVEWWFEGQEHHILARRSREAQ